MGASCFPSATLLIIMSKYAFHRKAFTAMSIVSNTDFEMYRKFFIKISKKFLTDHLKCGTVINARLSSYGIIMPKNAI